MATQAGKYSVRSFILFLLLILYFFSAITVYSQDQKTKLENDKKKIEDEIKYNSKLLDETKKTQETTLNQLVVIKKQISTREKLINNINSEIKAVNDEIELNNQTLKELNDDLIRLKEEYAAMIYYAHKNRSSYDKLMFIFSSSDFNQAYKRLKYFQQYSAYRKTQVLLIEETQAEIKKKLEDLENLKLAKVDLLRTFETERTKLSAEKTQQSKTITDLNKKEKELLTTIKEKEKAAKKLQKEIEKIIAEEINTASKKTGTTKSGPSPCAQECDDQEQRDRYSHRQGCKGSRNIRWGSNPCNVHSQLQLCHHDSPWRIPLSLFQSCRSVRTKRRQGDHQTGNR
jgi:septal ring factor EnvC (AmiA/AmiB activator)